MQPGTKLGVYEIVEAIGVGGMGEVYRARDSKLGRDVAIKVLSPEFAHDKARLARFEREAKLLAALNHPGIATLFGLETSEHPFLVMELVEGETLAERIARGPISVDDALPLFVQMAEALEVAHEKGIVHRDLKPANVKITPGGKIKVLDFGLAKAFAQEGEPAEPLSQSPTLTKGTALGAIMGTAPYMSPEQARGKVVDKRTDVWAFGCCLFEALTGKKTFSGESITDVLAAVVKEEPAWDRLRQDARIRRLLRRCLEKNPRNRLHDIADARIELETGDGEPVESSGHTSRSWLWLTALAAGAAFAAGLWVSSGDVVDSPEPGVVARHAIELPAEAPLALGREVPVVGWESPVVAISPDGATLVYVGDSGHGKRLYQRALDGFDVTSIPGTEGAVHAFFSPDGEWVGFVTNDHVKKVALRGGTVITLCNATAPSRGSWPTDDVVYFAENEGYWLSRVPANGGAPTEIVRPAARLISVLPGGRFALISTEPRGLGLDGGNIVALSLETLETRTLVEHGYGARYSPSGHLVFARGSDLMAVKFDLERGEVLGDPATVLEDVSMESIYGNAHYAISEAGSLVYVPGFDLAVGRLAWINLEGNAEFVSMEERIYGQLDLSPDGTRAAVHVADVTDYILIHDFHRSEGRKVSVSGAAGWPVWNASGDAVAYTMVDANQRWSLARYSIGGGPQPSPFYAEDIEGADYAWSWSPAGDVIAVAGTARSGFLSLENEEIRWISWPDAQNVEFVNFSPDGRLVAYTSMETGQYEVSVRSYPEGDHVAQVSVDFGIEPVWCDNCGDLFYRKGNRWFASRVTLADELSWEPPRLVFETEFIDTPGTSYDVSPDGQRLLVVKRSREPERNKIHVIHNWVEELERLVPTS